MSWFDIVILIVAGIGVFVGWRIGFLGAIFTTLGVIVGMLLAGQLADSVAEALTDTVGGDTLATAIAYVIIVGGAIGAALVARNMVKKILSLVFLGWIDSVGSLALGLITGVLLAGAVITVTARYSGDLPTEGAVGFIVETSGLRGSLNDALVDSAIVPIFVDILVALPADALGLIPDDFALALEDLDTRIER